MSYDTTFLRKSLADEAQIKPLSQHLKVMLGLLDEIDVLQEQVNKDLTMTDTNLAAKIGNLVFEPLLRYIIVEEDKFKSGYECSKCDGSGIQLCRHCENKLENKPCKWCTEGYVTCTMCSGKGSTIVIPETAQRRPTTGIVRAIGPDVKNKELFSKRILYSSFAGMQISIPGATLADKIIVTILDENEVKCIVSGMLTPHSSMAENLVG